MLSTIQHNKGIKIVDTQWRNFTTGYLLRLIALNIFMEKTTICYCDYQNHRPYIVLKRLFSLIMVNFSNIKNIEPSMLIKINVSLACIICLFMGLILFFLNTNKKESQRMKLIFIVVMVVVLSTLVLTAIFM